LKISVITAVFNNRGTIAAALDSVLEQTHKDSELVVIDGGSTDGTVEILERYADRLGVLVSEPDQGIYDALNKGIQRASGDVVGFLHSDDVFGSNDVLSKVAEAFEDRSVGAVYGDLVYVKRDDLSSVLRYWRAGPFSKVRLSRGWMPPHPTVYVRREVYERLGGFDTRYRIAADYDHLLRIFSDPALNPRYIPEILVRMRVGGASNRSLQNIIRKSREDLEALRSNEVGGIGALAWKNVSKIGQFFRR
jgi:glycosyltransferase